MWQGGDQARGVLRVDGDPDIEIAGRARVAVAGNGVAAHDEVLNPAGVRQPQEVAEILAERQRGHSSVCTSALRVGARSATSVPAKVSTSTDPASRLAGAPCGIRSTGGANLWSA